ncbi:MAG: 2-amino-4-hydroxy-6-hydroxymethyldihydropteridine diphosphokinase [Pseudomonadota bacterium]|nr:2-amino-4-hydroxy-6-hydroxymethyldihydropteridine diphosphokinase [Pseudomonadota bacterium]
MRSQEIIKTSKEEAAKKERPAEKSISICYLGLGSNLDSPKLQIQKAVKLLKDSGLVDVFAISSMYESKPYGPVQDQNDFVNAVVGVKTWHSPFTILMLCGAIEDCLGRKRIQHWGPRVIDLDVLLYNNLNIATTKLIIPHADMHNRDFVMHPLAEVKRSKI